MRCAASQTGEGSVSADRDPSSGADFIRATFSHKGRSEGRVTTSHSHGAAQILPQEAIPNNGIAHTCDRFRHVVIANRRGHH